MSDQGGRDHASQGAEQGAEPGADQNPDQGVEELKAADATELHRAVREEGESELERPAGSLLWSALAAGCAINASLIAQGAIQSAVGDPQVGGEAWRHLVIGLGYPIGFVIVVLGRLQFFTESTVTAMLPFATHLSWRVAWRTVRLWSLVLVGNLLGTAAITLALAHLPLTDPPLHEAMIAVSAAILKHDAVTTFWTAIPAGFLIASIAWVLPNAREQSFLVIFAFTYVVGIAGFSHSVVGSAEAFALLWAGRVTVAGALGGAIAPAVLGNLIGGAGLFALLAHGQVRGEMD